MRWKYFTPGENSEEDDARQRVAARIDAWWDAFRNRADQLERFFTN